MSKKLTYEEFETLYFMNTDKETQYQLLLPYLADEQPAETTYIPNESIEAFNERIRQHLDSSHPTKPEPSRLEVAAMLLAGHIANSRNIYTDRTCQGMLEKADELIKQSKL